jgi:hypothetical protein
MASLPATTPNIDPNKSVPKMLPTVNPVPQNCNLRLLQNNPATCPTSLTNSTPSNFTYQREVTSNATNVTVDLDEVGTTHDVNTQSITTANYLDKNVSEDPLTEFCPAIANTLAFSTTTCSLNAKDGNENPVLNTLLPHGTQTRTMSKPLPANIHQSASAPATPRATSRSPIFAGLPINAHLNEIITVPNQKKTMQNKSSPPLSEHTIITNTWMTKPLPRSLTAEKPTPNPEKTYLNELPSGTSAHVSGLSKSIPYCGLGKSTVIRTDRVKTTPESPLKTTLNSLLRNPPKPEFGPVPNSAHPGYTNHWSNQCGSQPRQSKYSPKFFAHKRPVSQNVPPLFPPYLPNQYVSPQHLLPMTEINPIHPVPSQAQPPPLFPLHPPNPFVRPQQSLPMTEMNPFHPVPSQARPPPLFPVHPPNPFVRPLQSLPKTEMTPFHLVSPHAQPPPLVNQTLDANAWKSIAMMLVSTLIPILTA